MFSDGNKKILFWLLLAALVASQSQSVLAVEIQYPAFPGVEPPQVFLEKIQQGILPKESALPLFALYFCYLALVVAGLAILASILAGGVAYLTAGSKPEKMAAARERISSGFLGLFLILSSFLLVQALNPKLLVLGINPLPAISHSPIPTPVSLPSPDTVYFWEIPVGYLTANTLGLLPLVKVPSQVVENKSKILKQKTEQLLDLLSNCQCANLTSQCADLTLQCASQIPACGATGETLCMAGIGHLRHDITAEIDQAKNDVFVATDNLKAARYDLSVAKINLQKEATKLLTAEAMMKACPGLPFDRQTFLGLSQTMKTAIKKPWPSLPNNNPLTFYCQIEDKVVQDLLDQWDEMMQQAFSEFNLGPSPCQGGSCSEGTGDCTAGNLKTYFLTDAAAHSASVICQRESSSNPNAANYGCLNGSSLDYSIGLFQINLLAWCPDAFTYTTRPVSCTIIDQDKLDQCKTELFDPEGNIQKALRISRNGTNWNPWAAASACGVVSGVPACLPEPPPPSPGALSWPVSNPSVRQPFCQYLYGGKHLGIDIYSSNTDILAAADGTVTAASYLCADPHGRLGNYVTVSHNIQGNPYTTSYFHLASIDVNVGDNVTQGQKIGAMGNTCTGDVHLHFALKQAGVYTNPCLFLTAGAGGIGCPTTPATCSGF